MERVYRHVVAMIITVIAVWVIKNITAELYFYPENSLNIFQMFFALWQTHKFYFQLMAIMNFIFKPIFIYYLVIVMIKALK